MNKSESKYFHTARLMDKALIDLLEKKNLEYISVKEICMEAGVNRSTFYLHYETIADLLSETMEYIISEFMSVYQSTKEDMQEKIQNSSLDELVFINDFFLEPYLKFVYENQNVFRASFSNPENMNADEMYRTLNRHIFEPIMERFQIPKEKQKYYMRYYISGIMAIIEEWISENCRESIEQIKSIIMECVLPKGTLIEKSKQYHGKNKNNM